MCPRAGWEGPGISKIIAFFCQGSVAGKDFLEEISVQRNICPSHPDNFSTKIGFGAHFPFVGLHRPIFLKAGGHVRYRSCPLENGFDRPGNCYGRSGCAQHVRVYSRAGLGQSSVWRLCFLALWIVVVVVVVVVVDSSEFLGQDESVHHHCGSRSLVLLCCMVCPTMWVASRDLGGKSAVQ